MCSSMCSSANSQAEGEEGLHRRVCCLLSYPWVSELKALPAYRACGFPSSQPALAQSLGPCCGESPWPPFTRVNYVSVLAIV